MKLAALSASAVALTLAFITPCRAMDTVDEAFIVLGTSSFFVTNKCVGYERDDVRKAAEMAGVDFERYGPARHGGSGRR